MFKFINIFYILYFAQNGNNGLFDTQDMFLDKDSLDLSSVNYLLEMLSQKKQQLEAVSSL